MNLQADWIWARGCSRVPNSYIYARREFVLDSIPDAVLQVACSSHYKLFVNGRYAGCGPARPIGNCRLLDSREIKRYLRPGRNVIGAICHYTGDSAPAGFLAQLEIPDNNGSIVTDETWRVMPARDWDSHSGIGYREVYDSRLKPVGWSVVGFDDSGWEEPETIGEVGEELLERPIPLLEETDCSPVEIVDCGYLKASGQIVSDRRAVSNTRSLLQPRGGSSVVMPGEDAAIVLDFGREIVGFPGFAVLDGGEGLVEVACFEAINDHCTQDAQSTQTDLVTLHGGRQEWETFGRRTFRYLQLTFRNLTSPVTLRSVSARSIGYPVRQRWSFECSDDLINRVYRLGVDTLGRCMQDAFERDPLRDPSPSAADSRIQALANYYTFGDLELPASDLRRLAVSATGKIDQLLSWILMLHEYYLHSGDRFVLEDMYGHLRETCEERLLLRETSTGLLACGETATAALNALYYQALREASKLALALSDFTMAKAWHERAHRVLMAFNAVFWDESLGSYTATGDDVASSLRVNVLAVTCGLVNSERADRIAESIKAAATRLGPGLSHYTLDALAALEMVPEALEVIRAGWGAMIAAGATSCWSSFPVAGRRPVSMCRGRCAAPSGFLVSEVLGIKPSAPNSPVSIVQPKPGGLEWARGGYDLPTGRLDVWWSRSETEFSLEIDGPDGFVVAVPVTGFDNPVIREVDLTPETPERKARRTYGWGDVIWRGGEERDPYLDWLASQEEAPPAHYEPKRRCEQQGLYVWISLPCSTHVRYIVCED